MRRQEVANLDLLRRQAMGAAHTLNNVFTALLGELTLLSDERKDDPVVEEAVNAVRSQLERCVKLVRTGLVRPRLPEPVEAEVDLGLLVSRCMRLLDGGLSRRIVVDSDVPDDSWVVRGDPAQLEILLLAVVHRMADLPVGGCAELTIGVGVGQGPDTVCLRFDLAADELEADARQRLVDPALAEHEVQAATLEAVHEIADHHGTHLQTERTADHSLRVSVAFPRLAD